eukprot:COSAG02_NODE_3332_length_6919_cov_3.232551_9_plen_48_part_00
MLGWAGLGCAVRVTFSIIVRPDPCTVSFGRENGTCVCLSGTRGPIIR